MRTIMLHGVRVPNYNYIVYVDGTLDMGVAETGDTIRVVFVNGKKKISLEQSRTGAQLVKHLLAKNRGAVINGTSFDVHTFCKANSLPCHGNI